jgi:membrane protein insertase Oxa1/YidC/SpoIIIJ
LDYRPLGAGCAGQVFNGDNTSAGLEGRCVQPFADFDLQQKLTPQQAAASANPQVAQQQKMMMIMMPLLFPLMLYTAPSGVNLYIMASTFAGVIEQYVIKKHIREKEEAESNGLVAVTSKTGGKVKKKKPKPFFRT